MPTATLEEIIDQAAKSAGDVTAWASSVQAQSRGQQAEKSLSLTGQSLTNLQQQINNTRRAVGQLAINVNEIGGITIADIVAAGFRRSWTDQDDLAAGVNNITFADPDNVGDSLTIWRRQNGAGSGTVTFGANILFCDPYAVTNLADSVTVWETRAMVDPTDSTVKWFAVSPANAEQLL